MYGISSSSKDAIAIAIEKMFDQLAYNLLGNIPKLRDKSPFFGSAAKFSLAHIFVQALNNRELNHVQRDILRSILNSSYGYIESLKSKTSSNVAEAIDALVKESRLKNTLVTTSLVVGIMAHEMGKARSHMKLIAEAETTKTRNLGHLSEIISDTKNEGIEDPTVFFIIVRDGKNCVECLRLHMLPDGVTPKVYRMSELSMNWHKRGEDRPSCNGEHPGCRCSLQQLPPGWGFKAGYLAFISLDWDEYKKQRGLD